MKTVAGKGPGRPVDPGLRDRRCEEILDAAARLFAEHGFSKTDTQILADELGVGKGTLYRYFPSKRALFLAAVDRVMRQARARVDARIADISDPLQRIAQAVRTFLGFCDEHPYFVELLIQERAHFKDRKKPTYFEHRETHIERWKAMYRGLIAEGRVRDMSVERITDVVSQLIYGTIFINYFAGQSKTSAEQADDILDILFHGILADAGRRPLGRNGARNGSRIRAKRRQAT